jgi:4-hydroxybenzoate polyprenyltransferase
LNGFLSKLKTFTRLIKFEHTVFALPFAYVGMLTARRSWPALEVFFWTTVAMVAARTAGMTLNRLIDLKIDAKNPRTMSRPSVTGAFPVPNARIAAGVSIVVFFFAAYSLNPLAFKLSPVALFFLCTYHYVKRFHWLCHYALGVVLGIAPMGGWIAVTGQFSWTPVWMALAVCVWTAGFDILYSLQDESFDRENGLHSIPVKFGHKRSLQISAYSHVATVVFLAAFGFAAGLGVLYWAGLALVGGLLWLEHWIIGDGDLSKIDTAFFTINGWVGILLFIFCYLEVYR